jgi:hypothetical protein
MNPVAPRSPSRQTDQYERSPTLVVLKVLHRFLMRLGSAPAAEGSKIPPFSGLGILFARIQAIFPGFEFSDHSSKSPLTISAVRPPGAACFHGRVMTCR